MQVGEGGRRHQRAHGFEVAIRDEFAHARGADVFAVGTQAFDDFKLRRTGKFLLQRLVVDGGRGAVRLMTDIALRDALRDRKSVV